MLQYPENWERNSRGWDFCTTALFLKNPLYRYSNFMYSVCLCKKKKKKSHAVFPEQHLCSYSRTVVYPTSDMNGKITNDANI